MEFIKKWRKSDKNIIAILLLDAVGNLSLSRFTFWNRLALGQRRLLAAAILFAVFECFELIAFTSCSRPISPILAAATLSSLISSLCIYAIACCHRYSLRTWKAACQVNGFGHSAERRFLCWLNKWTKSRYQVIASVLSVAFFVGYALAFRVFVDSCDAVVMITPIALAAGQGFYWGITSPLIAAELRRSRISELGSTSVLPGRSPVLVAFSKVFSVFALWLAALITLAVVFILLAQKQIRENALLYAWGAAVISYLGSGWTFIYPQVNLSNIARRLKENSLLPIQAEIDRLFASLPTLTQPDVDRLKSLVDLHEFIGKSVHSLVDLSMLRAFLLSILGPTVPAIVGVILK